MAHSVRFAAAIHPKIQVAGFLPCRGDDGSEQCKYFVAVTGLRCHTGDDLDGARWHVFLSIPIHGGESQRQYSRYRISLYIESLILDANCLTRSGIHYEKF